MCLHGNISAALYFGSNLRAQNFAVFEPFTVPRIHWREDASVEPSLFLCTLYKLSPLFVDILVVVSIHQLAVHIISIEFSLAI